MEQCQCHGFVRVSTFAVTKLIQFVVECIRKYGLWTLCRLLQEKILPQGNTIPRRRDEIKNILAASGLGYHKIHACPNDCMVYYPNDIYKDTSVCPTCGASRYNADAKGKTVPMKVARYFPLIPRIKLLFRCESLASLMGWCAANASGDNVLRVVSDCKQWKHIDETWPDFGREPRNLRLGLATDGVNPYGRQSAAWSTWPVVLINYNLPPWLLMKTSHLMVVLLVPGPKKPESLDPYLKIIIDELLTLWSTGIEVYDVSRALHNEQRFTLRAILMWTTSDWPGLYELSGLQVSGYAACHLCGSEQLNSRRSTALHKNVYANFRRFLPLGNRLRYVGPRDKHCTEPPPKRLTMKDWANLWDAASAEGGTVKGMKWKASFVLLPYWTELKIHHLLDPMHIFKNVSASIWRHVTGRKDTDAAREDLQEAGSKANAWLNVEEGTRPQVDWIVPKKSMKPVREAIKAIKTPTGYMHSLRNCFSAETGELTGLKSHDWHKMLQV